MKLTIAAFQGRVPRLGDRHLQDTQATIANNCKLTSGELRAYRNNAIVNNPALTSGGILTCYLYGKGETYERWLQWDTDVDVSKGPIAGDTTERTYFTGTDKPRVFDKDMVDVGGDDEEIIAELVQVSHLAPVEKIWQFGFKKHRHRYFRQAEN